MTNNKRIGERYRLNAPEDSAPPPGYSAHRGQEVTVVSIIDGDDPEVEPMYEVVADDNWRGFALGSELEELE